MFSKIVFLALLIVGAIGHAVLESPTPWNTQPSTSQVCGGGTISNNPRAIWTAGSQYTISWRVVAGDGAGAVMARVVTDPAQSTSAGNFGTPVQIGTTSTTGPFSFSYTVPNVVCTGPGGVCALNVYTGSWTSCTTVQILAQGSQNNNTAPPQPSYVNATGLTTCTMVNGRRVMVPFGVTLSDLDVSAQQALDFNYNNPKVFYHKDTAGCYNSLKYAVCAATFIGLSGNTNNQVPSPCRQVCDSAICLCGLNVTHNNLFPCSTYFNYGSDSTGSCSSNVATFPSCTLPGQEGSSSGDNGAVSIAPVFFFTAIVVVVSTILALLS